MRERGREAKGCTVVPWGSRVPHVEVGAEGWNLEDLILLYSCHSFATLRWQLPTARFMDHAPQRTVRGRGRVFGGHPFGFACIVNSVISRAEQLEGKRISSSSRDFR